MISGLRKSKQDISIIEKQQAKSPKESDEKTSSSSEGEESTRKLRLRVQVQLKAWFHLIVKETTNEQQA